MEKINLPHTHLVQKGDTLPELCQQIYNDSSYYIQVAKFNGLNKFRSLKAGTRLVFPPILSEK